MTKPITVKALRAKQEAAKPPAPTPAAHKPKPRRPKVVAPPAAAPQTPTPAPEIPVGKDQVAINEAYELPYDPPSYHFEASADPHVELASRELCRRKLLPFIQRFRPKYTAGWVHEDICRRIERFVKQVEQGLSPRLLLMMPPRSGKSEISSRHTPAWILGQHPEWEIIAGSHTSSLSLSFSRYLRDVMRDAAYTAVFPDARLDPSSQSVENWNLTKGGGYLAAGVGTGITGRGAHVLLLDDLVKDIEAADSITIRDNTWEWYLSTAYTRLAPGGGVLGLMCMTGDTQVLMADGATKRLDTLKASDKISTYRNGALSASRVAALKSSGRDSVYRILTNSGKIVRANQRHPFLTVAPDGELVWTRVQSLTTAHKIVALKGSGVSGKTLAAQSKGVTSLPSVVECAHTTTTKSAGPTGTVPSATVTSHVAMRDSNTAMGSPGRTTTECTLSKVESAPFAEVVMSASLNIGKTSSLSTTATTLEKFAGCSATTVMRGLDTLELSRWHLPLLNTSDFTPEQIVSIELDGEEEVFDVQVDDTENFIANGLVSHNTWWHQDDWAGRIQEAMLADDGADKFEIIRYPAINEYGDEFILADESILEIPPTEPVPPGSRLTRRMGTAIHPQRYTTEMMLRIKHNLVGGGQKRVWDALYQQNPIPDEGNYFSKDMFRYYGSAPDRRELYIYQAWDFAISEGKESDYTVGMCIGVDHRDNVYVLDVRRFRSGDSFLIVDTILDFARDYDADALGFEDGQIWKAIESQFAKRCDERRHFPAYEVLKPLTDKMVRANPLRGRMQLGKVFFDKNARWFTEMYKELLYFPAGKHDDQCLIAGTLITLGDGSQRAIECIRVGDLVQTPVGPRPVVAAKMTSPSATVYEAAGLIGTANHPVFTQNRGWIGLAHLSKSDILQFRVSTDQMGLSCHAFTKKQLRTSTVLSSMASYIAAIRTRIVSTYSVITRALEDVVFCIVMCGHSTTGLSPKDGWSTTSTRTTLTTTLQTSNVCPEKSTQITDMQNSKRTAHHLSNLNTLRVFADKLHFGIAHLKASLGTNRTVKMLGRIATRSILCASIVGLRLSPLWRTLSSAQNHVETSTGIKHILNTTLPRMLDAKQPVFNITVADAHCYYANGVLVHNCDALSWSIRLTLSRLAPRQKDYTPKLKSWKDDLGRFMDTGGASHMCS